ncbi:hypothetical protein [Flavobacterium soli]|uniref:hypothetical protein n=1 Tax=Flavobacterium soli TaxID=344881 RepID=UPI00047D9877|nr:hypothetical protein [Flavobacterium soli]
MSEEAIMISTISMKIDALEVVLSAHQLEQYRKALLIKRENFITIWAKYLTPERLEEALVSFEI